MSSTIEVIYEDNVLKPLKPIEGLREHQKLRIILCPLRGKGNLHELVGTLSHQEAEAMQNLIDKEFERIEGEW
ncbi:MAG: antitoxin family protein [Methanosarcinales archaeon]